LPFLQESRFLSDARATRLRVGFFIDDAKSHETPFK
jgi:hypothetical protein